MTNIQVQYWANQELARHNQATEGETYRHNVVMEHQNQQSITEVARHNQATENLQFLGLQETRRHNVVTEGESKRHNLAAEAIGRTQATASIIQAEAARSNAATNAERVESENQLRSAQLEYQNMTNRSQAFDNDLKLNPFNKVVGALFSPIGAALGAASGGTNAAGGVFSSAIKAIS